MGKSIAPKKAADPVTPLVKVGPGHAVAPCGNGEEETCGSPHQSPGAPAAQKRPTLPRDGRHTEPRTHERPPPPPPTAGTRHGAGRVSNDRPSVPLRSTQSTAVREMDTEGPKSP